MSDVSNSTILTMFIVIFATIVFPMIIPIKENVSLVIKVVSLLPVVSTVAVPKLLLLGQVSNLYAVFSVVIAIVSMILLTIYGSKEFKKGLLSTTRGSKKEERVTKAKDTDLNDVKFKSSMSKIGVALLLYLILSNLLGMAQQMLFQTESVYINYIVKMIIWTLSIYPSYWYLRNSNYENKEEKVKEISTKEIACYTFLTFGILWLVQIICSMIVSGDYSVNDMIDLDFSSPLKVIFAFVEIALLPAIFEELLFRKAIFGSLKKYGMKIAIFVSSFAFAIMHQNFEQAILAFLIGILFCILDSKTGRIYPSMIVHFINNSIGVIQIMYGETESISLVDIIGVFCIIAMIISIISLIIMKIKKIGIFKKEEVEEYIKLSNPLRLAFSDFMTVIALVIYLLNTVYISIYVL